MSISDFTKGVRKNITPKTQSREVRDNEYVKINPNLCKNWKYADRQTFELGEIEALANDIKENGQHQPIVIRPIKHKKYAYEVIAGERRWRACKQQKIDVTAICRDLSDLAAFKVQAAENDKHSLSDYSKAMHYHKVIKDGVISQNKLAESLGVHKSTLSHLMAFTKVDSEVWNEVGDMSKVSGRTAGAIRALCSRGQDYLDAVLMLTDKIRDGIGANVLQKYVEDLVNPPKKEPKKMVITSKSGKELFTISKNNQIVISSKTLKNSDVSNVKKQLKLLLEKIVD
ncbi:ParB/RepB/Spo0J family partition protein [Piscirickettsia litoralis]|uniref:ParB-like N-terminal domain-containing protein n=1 Tax=Piscirickettsia litoralis TaxID=1891921 RepID=A0ABX2ZZ99_9GAMM|nr:ParB/RepB/Spo0J family partition protein [Piscirickettsia litoralis]ODN41347.1 hypothetical protein BGC07_16380 [Piscirickettsia litoralis]